MARSIFFYTDSRVLGGAENAMLMLLESLDREDWRPTLLLGEAAEVEPLARRAVDLGVRVERVPPMPLGLRGARRVAGMARVLRRRRPDVFHAHMSSPVACKWALAAAVAARVPAVLGTVQVGGYEPPDRSAYWQLRALSRGVDRYLAVSGEIAVELVERLGWPADGVEVVHNAVDVDRFAVPPQPELREELGGGEGRPLVLTPARLDEQKGHLTLLEAAAAVPGATFILAGEGPERPSLEARAAELGVAERVRFLGRRDDVPQLLAACDAFALPSRYEGSSLAVLEAMAAGLPVVGSAIGGTEELIDDGVSGLLVPPGDPGRLAAALRRLLEDASLRESLAGRARERVRSDFGRERMAARVTAVYAELLEGRAGRGAARVAAAEALPESRRNGLLRRADWRFALPEAERVASWRLPRPGALRRARRRAEAAGYSDLRAYWAGPLPGRLPQFWLPLDSPEAAKHLLASRPAGSAFGWLLRLAWRLARCAGLLAPVHLIGRRAQSTPSQEPPLPAAAYLLLLTPGRRSINKVVGLAFERGADEPAAAAKFARVADAEPGLEREASALRLLEERLPDVAGVPRLRGEGRRDGRLAIVESPVEGRLLLDDLTPERFEEQAMRVVRLLVDLAGNGAHRVQPTIEHRMGGEVTEGELGGRRLAEEAIAGFASDYGPAVPATLVADARAALDGLGNVPAAFEHRDCSPWNVVVGADGSPVLLDWESAEPDGLAGMDLVYFLANCAFVLDGALESGRTVDSYRQLLDPASPHGRVAARAVDAYTAAVGMSAEDFHRVRLLCWIVHSRSDYRHLQLEAQGQPPPEALRGAVFLGLVEEELDGLPWR